MTSYWMKSYQHQSGQCNDNHNNDVHYFGPEAYSHHDVCLSVLDDDDDGDENGCCVSVIISGWPSLTHDTY